MSSLCGAEEGKAASSPLQQMTDDHLRQVHVELDVNGDKEASMQDRPETVVKLPLRPKPAFLNFGTSLGRFETRDLSQRLRAALMLTFPRRMHFLDAYSPS